ncbi:hypothetical protein ECTPHS_12682 [Ectothiorhodospira sp. PHS-1]|nr:hypothetical protein ECTPHS_12682 [Ectothiorhodospira sp. PHS-1]
MVPFQLPAGRLEPAVIGHVQPSQVQPNSAVQANAPQPRSLQYPSQACGR